MEPLLKELGLNKYEIKAYLALLGSEPITAYKLGKLSGVPSGRVYDIMDTLTLKGLVAVEPGKPKRFMAIKPELALVSLLTKKDREWGKVKRDIEKVITKIKKREVKEEPISIVKERDIFGWKILDSFKIAKKDVLAIAGGLTGMKKGIDIHGQAKKALKRGVKIRIILSLTRKNKKQVAQILKAGIPVRNYPIKGLRLYITDNKQCLLTIADESLPYKRATITIQSPEFCKSMKKLFEALWEKAEPIELG